MGRKMNQIKATLDLVNKEFPACSTFLEKYPAIITYEKLFLGQYLIKWDCEAKSLVVCDTKKSEKIYWSVSVVDPVVKIKLYPFLHDFMSDCLNETDKLFWDMESQEISKKIRDLIGDVK